MDMNLKLIIKLENFKVHMDYKSCVLQDQCMGGKASVKSLDLDITEPVDLEHGMKSLGPNSQQLYYEMLERLESLSIDSTIK